MQVTILRTTGPLLAKTWQDDGTIKDYDLARKFVVSRRKVGSVAGLYALLHQLQDDSRACIIRGVPREEPTSTVLRNLDVFADAPSNLFMIDVDGYTPRAKVITEAVEEFVATLPACFQDVTYVWQLSGSCGHPTKAGQLRAHLWFWLAEPLTCAQAEAWSAKYLPGVDQTVHRTVQVNYTARPVMVEGESDPYAVRLGLTQSMLDQDVLQLPADMPVPDVSAEQRTTRANRMQLVDPREKQGIVGAVCRAIPPLDLVAMFPDHFVAGSRPERITWQHGGGTPEGIRITDSGTHLFNSHSTAPVTRAANVFDFIRTHVFGHLDAGTDQDVLDLDPQAAPSYVRMVAWATSLPQVQQELTGPKAEAAAEAAKDARAEQALDDEPSHEQRMQNLQQLIAQATSMRRLEHDIARRVAKSASLSDAEREMVALQLQRRTSELMGGRGLPIAIIRGWLAPVSTLSVFPDRNADNTPKATIENLQALCAQLGVTIRYDVIRKRQEILAPGTSFSGDNYDNASLSWLTSQCAKVGMPYGMSVIKGYVGAIADANQYNPVLVWIESRAWDGRSRLRELAETVNHRRGFDAQLKEKILRTWLIQAVAAAASPVPLQLRGMMVFQGPQYIGKTRWLLSLVPGYEHFAITGRQVDPHNKDSVYAAISHWLCEWGELDGSIRKADVAAMKAFISQDSDTMRLPYAAAESKFQRRTVMFGSVNTESFLADATGNTRYWVIPVDTLNFDHGLDMQQLWAEILVSWRSGEAHFLSEGDMATVNHSGGAFEQVCPVYEKVAVAFPWEQAHTAPDSVRWTTMSATEILEHVGVRSTGAADTNRCTNALKKLRCHQAPRTKTLRGWRIPLPRDDFAGLQ